MDYYNFKAKELFDIYQSVDPEKLHARWAKHLPPIPELALDVGGGSGRDAKWLAKKGWKVVVVEPANRFSELGRKYTAGYKVIWVDDSLPELFKLDGYKNSFSLILVCGVFMHLSLNERLVSFNNLVDLMSENAVMLITLRHGPDSEDRGFLQVDSEEIVELAKKEGLQTEVYSNLSDELGRKDVYWESVIVSTG